MTKIEMPFNGKYRLTQDFGVYYYYKNRKVKHQGTDWALPGGTDVIACFNGIVSRVEKWRLTGYGKSIYLRSLDSQFEALYAHLSSLNVQVGDKVKIGNIIGQSGRSGFCRGKTGYHLHFGLKKYGKYIDPVGYLNLPDRPLELPSNNFREYTVKKGDSLWKIAVAFYGKGGMWKEIYNANLDIINNSDKIYPGQVFKIPNLD